MLVFLLIATVSGGGVSCSCGQGCLKLPLVGNSQVLLEVGLKANPPIVQEHGC